MSDRIAKPAATSDARDSVNHGRSHFPWDCSDETQRTSSVQTAEVPQFPRSDAATALHGIPVQGGLYDAL